MTKPRSAISAMQAQLPKQNMRSLQRIKRHCYRVKINPSNTDSPQHHAEFGPLIILISTSCARLIPIYKEGVLRASDEHSAAQ